MKLSSFIPPEYRALAILGVLLALCGAAFATGWTVSKWKSDAAWSDKVSGYQSALALRDLDVVTLKASIGTQNAAVERLREESDAKVAAQEAARLVAVEAASSSARRLAALKKMLDQGAPPEKVLKSYWEMSR